MNAVQSPVLIMAGGTGGHIFPGLAVAHELASRNVPVVWLGSTNGMECQVVRKAGLPLETIDISSLRGRGWRSLLVAPIRLLRASWQAWRILRRHRPSAVLSMGGFASGPGGLVAWCTRRKLVVHEQNTIPGMTNRILARLADEVMTGFPDTLAPKGRYVGNPVRSEFWRGLEFGAEQTPSSHSQPRLLVLGGSQGAAPLNAVLPEALMEMPEAKRPAVLHQAGRNHLDAVRDDYGRRGLDVDVQPFIDDMAAAYRWADLVVCRAGALTLAELAAVGLAALLVPYPHAVDDHQTQNARCFADIGAAVLIPQRELSASSLGNLLCELLADAPRLTQMGKAASQLSRPDAAERVASACILERAA